MVQKIIKSVLTGMVALTLISTMVSADAAKGQKLYGKKLKKACGINGGAFAKKHTQDEWKSIGKSGMAKEIQKMCPKVKKKALKGKYLQHYLDFSIDFASDSGNVPSC